MLFAYGNVEGGKLIGLESFVAIEDKGTGKAKEKIVADAALRQARYEAPGRLAVLEYYMLTWRDRGNEEYGMLPKESLELGMNLLAGV